jgi:hypothetical protein
MSEADRDSPLLRPEDDELLSTTRQAKQERVCTCHPNEAPQPCPQRYAYSECVLAAEVERLRAEVERLRALLDAARICFKNRDQSEREAAVYAAICHTLQGM